MMDHADEDWGTPLFPLWRGDLSSKGHVFTYFWPGFQSTESKSRLVWPKKIFIGNGYDNYKTGCAKAVAATLLISITGACGTTYAVPKADTAHTSQAKAIFAQASRLSRPETDFPGMARLHSSTELPAMSSRWQKISAAGIPSIARLQLRHRNYDRYKKPLPQRVSNL